MPRQDGTTVQSNADGTSITTRLDGTQIGTYEANPNPNPDHNCDCSPDSEPHPAQHADRPTRVLTLTIAFLTVTPASYLIGTWGNRLTLNVSRQCYDRPTKSQAMNKADDYGWIGAGLGLDLDSTQIGFCLQSPKFQINWNVRPRMPSISLTMRDYACLA